MTNKYLRVVLGIFATMLLASTASANVLVNPGFEDPPFPGAEDPGAGSGWTAFGANFRVQQTGGGCDPISCAGAHGGTVSLKNFGEAGVFQEFSTTAGQVWEGSAWVINPENADAMVDGQIAGVNIEWWGGGNFISAILGDAVGADLALDVWTQLFVSGAAPAGADTARLVLITGPFAGPGGGAPRWDDASFQVVPIPGAILLMGSGLLGLMGFRRKKAA